MNTTRGHNAADRADTVVIADDRIAFIKPWVVDGRPGFAIHAADGTPIGWHENRDVAFAAVRQHDLEPVSVH
jgi:hypothetical protein